MKPTTIINLNAQAFNGITLSFKGLFGMGSETLTYRAIVPSDFDGTTHDAMVLLLRSIECRAPDPVTTDGINALLEEVIGKAVEEKLGCSFRVRSSLGLFGFEIDMEVSTHFDTQLQHISTRNQPRPQRGGLYNPILCQTEHRHFGGSVPAQPSAMFNTGYVATVKPSMGYTAYGESDCNHMAVPHARNVYEMLDDYFAGRPSFGGLERDTLARVGRTQGGYNAVVQEFETFKNRNRDSFSRVHGMLETFFNIVPCFSFESFVNDFHGFVEAVLKDLYSETAAQHFTLAFINAMDRLKKTPPVGLPLTEKDYREEAELALFNTIATLTLGMVSLFSYDPRDVWDDALKACPPVTEFAKRINGLEGKEELSDPDLDNQLLEEVLRTPHSTPAAVGAALYILDEVGRGLPTPTLLELLPQTFVLDFSDYCKALGGEGPFGFKQLQEVKNALVNRWLISHDSALAVLRTQLDPVGFRNLVANPQDAHKLEAAVYVLLEQRTLLYVNYPE